jgi:Zn-dependent peptidase ImmA (M78 family)
MATVKAPRRTVQSTREAAALAGDVFAALGGVLPVDVEEISRRIGVQVRRHSADNDLSGMLVVKNGQALIVANADHPEVRQRFTIAHELGHFLMHWKPGSEAFFRDERSAEGTSPVERQANSFAAALLMPETALRRLVEGRKISPLDTELIDGLAETFRVSSHAMTIRLQSLRLIKLETYW